MIQLTTARNGSPTAKYEDVFLHSRYDPAEEARRFVSLNPVPFDCDTVVVLGPGLGYLFNAIRSAAPDVTVIGIYFSDQLLEARVAQPDHFWYPGSDTSLPSFLSRLLPEWSLDGLHVVEWEPMKRACPRQAELVRSAVTARLRQASGSLLSTAAFGKLWLTNAASNFLRIEGFYALPRPSGAIVIAASGPSLEHSIPVIAAERERIAVWALPSSVLALLSHGIEPDLIIHTDAGFFARHHMYASRYLKDAPVAMPLTSARPPGDLFRKAVVLNQKNFFESALLSRIHYPAPTVSPNGTVAGTAFELAQKYQRPIVLAGLDFSHNDVHSHAAPHSFDTLFDERGCRISPTLSTRVKRMYEMSPLPINGSQRTSSALKTYASWFSQTAPNTSLPVYRLNPSLVPIDGIKTIENSGFASVVASTHSPSVNTEKAREYVVNRDERRAILLECVKSWRKTLSAFAEGSDITHGLHVSDLIYFLNAGNIPELRKAIRRADTGRVEEICNGMVRFSSDVLLQIEHMAHEYH